MEGGRGRGRGRYSSRARGRGRVGGCHKGGGRLGYQGKQMEINGINVTDPTQSFTDDEWTWLGPNWGRAYVTYQRLHINGRGRGANGRGGVRGGNDQNMSVADVDQNTTHSTGTEKIHGQNQGTGRIGDRNGRNGGCFGRGAYQHYWLFGSISTSLTYLEASLLLMLVTILLVIPRSKLKYEPYCISIIYKSIIGQAKRNPGRIDNSCCAQRTG